MRTRTVGALGRALALCALVLFGAACYQFGNVETVSGSVNRANVTSLVASLEIGAGEIDVEGGADGIANTQFTTNADRIPKVDFTADGLTGRMSVTQAAQSSSVNLGPSANRWQLDLNDVIPLSLTVIGSSARQRLDLDTLTIDSLDVNSDSGEADVGLSGAQAQLHDISLKSASGGLHLTLDGVYDAPATINVESASGDVSADLNGSWSSDVNGTIKTDTAGVIITVPKAISVQIHAVSDLGFVDASGLTNSGAGKYVNGAAGGSVGMKLDIHSHSGNITIRVGS